MGMVDIAINGRRHQVQCGEGEEPRLKRLAAYIDSCASKITQQHGQVPEPKLLLLTSLTVADELADAYEEVKKLRNQLAEATKVPEREAAAALDRVAQRLEQLAAAMETP
jgi:cell division protein ZapA